MSVREYPPRPLVGIGVVLLRPGAVLLVRRGKPPAEGSWSLPGGAQKLGETAEAAARRELREEAGLEAGALHLVANVDSIHHDPAGRVQYHYTILDFAAEWTGGEPRAGGDVSAAEFAPLDALDRYALWSEAHRVIGLARQALSSAAAATTATSPG
jgi:8-oxo-dGTP diphosphatase